MEYMFAACSDIGISRKTNQDSVLIKKASTSAGEHVLAVVCDGLGGLERGELASATLVRAYSEWFDRRLAGWIQNGQKDYELWEQWKELILKENERIRSYALAHAVSMGTTVSALLLTQKKYYILNVGDSRVYELDQHLHQLTRDQTLVEREVQEGKITAMEAKHDKRRNILLQCVGVRERVYPDLLMGTLRENTVYMLCSDGFVHELSEEEIFNQLQPASLSSKEAAKSGINYLIEVCKKRQEMDNISAAVVKAVCLPSSGQESEKQNRTYVCGETEELFSPFLEETQELSKKICGETQELLVDASVVEEVSVQIEEEMLQVHTKEII